MAGLKSKLADYDWDSVHKRFLDKIEYDKNGCWNWTANTDKRNYPIMSVYYHPVKMHRYSYTYYNGAIPKGMAVCHHCDNPSCVNPQHLFVGTWQDNADDRDEKQRGRNQWGEWVRKKPHTYKWTPTQRENARQGQLRRWRGK